MIFTTVLVGFILYILNIIVKRWWMIRQIEKSFPTPPTHPITGILLHFPKDPPGIFNLMTKYFNTYGRNMLSWGFMYDSALWISNPDDMETILSNTNSKSAKKSADYDMLLPWLGTGLLISWGEKWYKRRKIITPSFHFSILEQFVEVFNRQSDVFVEKLRKFDGKDEFDIYTDVTHFTLDVICEASMGIKLNVQLEPNSEYADAVKEISVYYHKRTFHIFKNSTFLFELTSSNKRSEKELIQILHKFTNAVIDERRKVIDTNTHTASPEQKKRRSFLDMLLHATIDGKPLSDEDIREEVDTFMFEGHDTTASGIAFAIYHLSQNQNVQEKLLQELKDVLGENCSQKYISYQELNDLKYLDLVIKETLRITPPVPLVARELKEDTKLGGTIVPKGMFVTLFIYHMQHIPEFFPNPEKFHPERFLEPPKHPFAYTPFSAGARNCIGQKFAVLEMKTVLAKIVSNYKILPAVRNSHMVLQADIVLKSSNGIHICLKKRV